MKPESNMTRAQLIEYLTLYQKAAQDHIEAVAYVAKCQQRLELARQGLPIAPPKRGRPPKYPKKRRSPSLPKLEEQLCIAQQQAETAWKAYKQLDDMAVLPGLSTRQCDALLRRLSAEQADDPVH